DFILANAEKPPVASYRYASPSGCSPSMMKTFACSNQETESSNGRHRSSCAPFFSSFATGQGFDTNATSPVADNAGGGPTSVTLAEGAKMVSAACPGKRRSSTPFESALILGVNFRSVSSPVTKALITEESSATLLVPAVRSRDRSPASLQAPRTKESTQATMNKKASALGLAARVVGTSMRVIV